MNDIRITETGNERKKKIAVLFGGCSTEYEVSLQSAHAVIENMDTDRYEQILIGISPPERTVVSVSGKYR